MVDASDLSNLSDDKTIRGYYRVTNGHPGVVTRAQTENLPRGLYLANGKRIEQPQDFMFLRDDLAFRHTQSSISNPIRYGKATAQGHLPSVFDSQLISTMSMNPFFIPGSVQECSELLNGIINKKTIHDLRDDDFASGSQTRSDVSNEQFTFVEDILSPPHGTSLVQRLQYQSTKIGAGTNKEYAHGDRSLNLAQQVKRDGAEHPTVTEKGLKNAEAEHNLALQFNQYGLIEETSSRT